MSLSRRSVLGTVLAAGLTPHVVKSADGNILRIGYGGLPREKGNPFSNIQTPSILVTGGVFDGLTRFRRDGSIKPWLATAWEPVNALIWRFKLRDDVIFSNGKPFDADSVVHTVEYLAGPGPQTEGMRRDMRFLAGAKALDKYTVEIETKAPVPMFPRYAAVLLIVESEAWQSMDVEQFKDTPVGTGPLRIEEWEPARCITRANRTSWRPLAIDGVDFTVLPDVSSRIQALLSGGLDVAYQLAPEDFPTVESIGGSIASVKDGATTTIMLHFQRKPGSPLQDVRVRRALNHAVDKQTIVDVLLGGRTVLATQSTVREAYGYDPSLKPFAYDPEKAKALLTEAGYGGGFDMTLQTAGGGTNGWLVVQRVADDLSRVGVRVEVTQLPVNQFLLSFVRDRIEADAFTLQWGTYPILDAIQTTNINSCRKPSPWYCDRTIQPVIEAAWVETDPDKALALRHQVMRHYHEQLPCIYLHENIAFQGIHPRISGYRQTFGYIDFENVRIS